MQSIFYYVVQPLGERYNNKKQVDDINLLVNTQIFTHQNVNRIAVVKSTPMQGGEKCISIGDEVIVHHNVFRRYHDIRGNEKNGRSYIDKDNYLCSPDQVFAYKKIVKWTPTEG